MDPRFPTGKFAFNPNPTAETRRECIAAIGSFPAELKAALATARIDQPYREGGWTGAPGRASRCRQPHECVCPLPPGADRGQARPSSRTTKRSGPSWPTSTTEDPAVSVQILDGLHQRWHAMLVAMSDARLRARGDSPRARSAYARLVPAVVCLARSSPYRPPEADGFAGSVGLRWPSKVPRRPKPTRSHDREVTARTTC